MGLAKKGSRCISIEGEIYRWLVSPNDGYMVLVVELADEPGQRLEVYFKYHDLCEPTEQGGLRIVGQRSSILPSVVWGIVLAALAEGWRPQQRGLPPFQMRDTDRLPQVGEQEVEPGA